MLSPATARFAAVNHDATTNCLSCGFEPTPKPGARLIPDPMSGEKARLAWGC
jgi:hypothetical protein